MKRIAVLGSTGSVGVSTLDVAAAHPESLSVIGLSAKSNAEALGQQVRRHRPQVAAVLDAGQAEALRRHGLPGVEVCAGVDGLTRVATHPDVDLVVVATSGSDALVPLVRAIEAGKHVAIASKELLVLAGELVTELARSRGVRLIPIDSEHAALFQLLAGVPREHVERLIITGSGGPLWSWPAERIAQATPAEVLRHPKWQMGRKITVDSATLMNKGLEMIEARWLFGVPLEQIRVVIHPQAVVHGMVELHDGSCLAQMAPCDMRLPIQAALSFPDRWPAARERLSWTALSGLEFHEPDAARFPCLGLAQDAARAGGSACAVLSAANDVAVAAFLRGELSFGQIPQVIRGTLEQQTVISHPTLEQILECDRWARATAQLGLMNSKEQSAHRCRG